MNRDDQLMRPHPPAVRKIGAAPRAPSVRRLVVWRAALAAAGASLTVLPIFGLRVLMMLGLVAMTQRNAGLLTYLPFELLVPFVAGLLSLRARPALSTLGLSTRVFLASLIGAPLLLAAAMGQEVLRFFGTGADVDLWMMLMGLVPAVGTLGVVGMLFAFFPLLTLSLGLTAGGDYLFRKRYGPVLLDAERVRELERAKREGVYEIPGLPKPELRRLTQNYDALHEALAERLSREDPHSETSAEIRHLREQLHAALAGLAQLAKILGKKLSPSELTYVRYMGSAHHLYETLSRQIARGCEVDGPELRRIVAQGDESLRVMSEAAEAVRRMRVGSGREALDLTAAAQDLDELAKRAEKY